MIDESINYKDLANYLQLALEEYKYYNKNSRSCDINDVIDWLCDFSYLDANTRGLHKKQLPKEPPLRYVERWL